MEATVSIESESGNLENLGLQEDISWSMAVYGSTFLGRLKRFLSTRTKIIQRYRDNPYELFLKEAHHLTYGRPWITGKYQLDFMKSIGLRPNEKLLDFGCGSGRFGVRVINYLEDNNYYGLDSHLPSLQAFLKYELLLNDLFHKKPRLFRDESFNFSHFECKFDWIMDFYVSQHLAEANYSTISTNAYDALEINGKYVLSPPIDEMKKCMIDNGFIIDLEIRQSCDTLRLLECEDFNDWIVFKKV